MEWTPILEDNHPIHPSTQAHPSRRVRYKIETINIKNNDDMPPFTSSHASSS